MNEADLLLVVGRLVLEPHRHHADKPIIQVDVDPMRSGSSTPSTVPRAGATSAVTAPAASSLRARRRAGRPAAGAGRAVGAVAGREGRGARPTTAAAGCRRGACSPRSTGTCPATPSHGRRRQPRVLVRALLRVPAGQAVLMSGYLGSIGFGYPAAMGAWAAARPSGRSSCVTGDGGFGQYMAELTDRGEVRHAITHVLLEQRAARQDQPRSSGRASGTSGRPRCTTRRSPPTRSSRARSGSGSRHAAELDDALGPRARARRPVAGRGRLRPRSRMRTAFNTHEIRISG